MHVTVANRAYYLTNLQSRSRCAPLVEYPLCIVEDANPSCSRVLWAGRDVNNCKPRHRKLRIVDLPIHIAVLQEFRAFNCVSTMSPLWRILTFPLRDWCRHSVDKDINSSEKWRYFMIKRRCVSMQVTSFVILAVTWFSGCSATTVSTNASGGAEVAFPLDVIPESAITVSTEDVEGRLEVSPVSEPSPIVRDVNSEGAVETLDPEITPSLMDIAPADTLLAIQIKDAAEALALIEDSVAWQQLLEAPLWELLWAVLETEVGVKEFHHLVRPGPCNTISRAWPGNPDCRSQVLGNPGNLSNAHAETRSIR